MASETDRTVKPYLHRVLADGVQPFRYRGHVRALLGLPEAGGVEMNFAKPLPIGGFAYLRPQITGEFNSGDEMPADNPRRVGGFADRGLPITGELDSVDETPADDPRRVGTWPQPGYLVGGRDGAQRGMQEASGRNGKALATGRHRRFATVGAAGRQSRSLRTPWPQAAKRLEALRARFRRRTRPAVDRQRCNCKAAIVGLALP